MSSTYRRDNGPDPRSPVTRHTVARIPVGGEWEIWVQTEDRGDGKRAVSIRRFFEHRREGVWKPSTLGIELPEAVAGKIADAIAEASRLLVAERGEGAVSPASGTNGGQK